MSTSTQARQVVLNFLGITDTTLRTVTESFKLRFDLEVLDTRFFVSSLPDGSDLASLGFWALRKADFSCFERGTVSVEYVTGWSSDPQWFLDAVALVEAHLTATPTGNLKQYWVGEIKKDYFDPTSFPAAALSLLQPYRRPM